MIVDVVPTCMEFHEVANIFPLIEGQEFNELVEDIRTNGLKQPIWTHQGKIIDGRNRYRACIEAKVEPRYQEWDGNGSLVAFTISLNVKRRHLTSSQLGAISIDVLSLFEKEAKERQRLSGGDHGNQYTGGKVAVPQNFGEPPLREREAAVQVAQLLGTNDEYVRTAKKIAEKSPELIEHVKDGTLTIPDAKAIAELPKERQTVVVEKAVKAKEEDGKRVSRAVRNAIWEEETTNIDGVPKAVPHILSKNNEWYTPWEYIDAARRLMGAIDVDPASNEFANQAVQADLFYDIRTNGLDKVWTGHVWLNPPYGYTNGRSNQDIWSQRLIDQYAGGSGSVKEAVLLVNAAVDTKWFHRLLAYPVCLTLGRINFSTPESTDSGSTHGSAFAYFGPHKDKFAEIFGQFGTVVRRW